MLLELVITRLKTRYRAGLLPTRSVRFPGLVVEVVEVAIALLLMGTAVSSVWQLALKHHGMLSWF